MQMPDPLHFENNPLAVGLLPDVSAIEFTSIESRYRFPLYYSTSLFFGIVFIAAIIVALIFIGITHWLSWTLLIVCFCLYLFALLYAQMRVERMKYVVRDRDVSFKEGVWFRNWITIPFNRIQHCEISRGIFDRMYKLAALKIYTAGGSGSDIAIPGLNQEDALRLRDFIITHIQHLDEEE